MFIHNHETEEGEMVVLHLDRGEASRILEVVAEALDNSPDGKDFTITLGLADHEHSFSDESEGLISKDHEEVN